MVKQLKNRYNDPTFFKRFTVGIDRAKMKLYNVEDSEVTEEVKEEFQPIEPVVNKSKFTSFVI